MLHSVILKYEIVNEIILKNYFRNRLMLQVRLPKNEAKNFIFRTAYLLSGESLRKSQYSLDFSLPFWDFITFLVINEVSLLLAMSHLCNFSFLSMNPCVGSVVEVVLSFSPLVIRSTQATNSET